MLPSLLAIFLAWGCSQPPACAAPEDVLATQGDRELVCVDAGKVYRYIDLLAGRMPTPREKTKMLSSVQSRWNDDPEGTSTWLAEVGEVVKTLEGQKGISGAEMRSKLVFQAMEGKGLITQDDELWEIQKFRISVWARDSDEELALTEADIEGWIFYASLCREVQGGGALRLSVSDRQQLYNTLKDRWTSGSRADLTALVAVGPYWSQARRGWRNASYEKQQAWIAEAPLPPPMTATSLGYADAIYTGDLSRHVAVLHDKIGPFFLGVD